MTKVFNYEQFLNEKYRNTDNDYAVGDIVMIRYNLTGDLCPVEIIAKKTHNYFIVSHKVKDSHLYNAPDHGIKSSEIIGRHRGVGDPISTTDRKTENPTMQPDTSGIIPGGDSWSNDISF
jgi:hypothetical protein